MSLFETILKFKKMNTKIFAFIFLLQILLGSCRDTSVINNTKKVCDNSIKNKVFLNDRISRINPPVNDSVACYLDSVIGRFHVKHFTLNDSTGKCAMSFSVGAENKLDSLVHYDRKLYIYIADGDYIFNKVITRADLVKIANLEEYESLCIRYVDVKLINDSNLLFRIGLEEEDNWSISYDFIYNNKTLVFKKFEDHSC